MEPRFLKRHEGLWSGSLVEELALRGGVLPLFIVRVSEGGTVAQMVLLSRRQRRGGVRTVKERPHDAQGRVLTEVGSSLREGVRPVGG